MAATGYPSWKISNFLILAHLLTSLTTGVNLKDIENELATVEIDPTTNIPALQVKLDRIEGDLEDAKRVGDQNIETLKQEVKGLNERLNRTDEEKLPEKISNLIIQKQFSEADDEISKIGVNSPKILLVVHECYKNHIGNFDILNNYTRSSRSIEIRFKIMSALWFEMKSNVEHMDPHKLLQMHETMEDEVIVRICVENDLKSNATRTKNEIYDAMKDAAVLEIKTNLDVGPVGKDRIQRMANALSDADEKYFNETIKQLIHENYDLVSMDTLLNIFYEKRKATQFFSTLMEVYRKYKTNTAAKDNAPLMIARYMKRWHDTGVGLNHRVLDKWNFLYKFLPKTAINLYFDVEKSIKNIEHNVYLSAIQKLFFIYVLYGANKVVPNYSIWISNRIGDFDFEFRSKELETRYLSEVGSKLKEKADGPNNNLKWKVNMIDEKVTLTNLETNKQLCMIRHPYNGFKMEMREDENSRECLWLVEGS